MFSREFRIAVVKELFTDDDGAGLHDAIFEANGKSYNRNELESFVMELPKELLCLALQWGISDTQFRDDVFTCLTKGKL